MMKRLRMKKTYLLLVVVLGLALMWSCQDDPEFPDPGFELEDQSVEVRRDTADVYTLSMEMEVPNGVDHIEVLNATNYDLIETVTGYEGKTNFSFNYEIDLTSFEQDTTLYYIFKVVDKDDRSTNRGFTLTVKRFSFPEITLVGGTSLNVVVPIYQVKGIVSTGLNELESVQVLFKGEEQFIYVPEADTAVYDYVLSEVIGFGTLESGEEYELDIIIKDNIGQESTTTITVRKSDGLKQPTGVKVYNFYNGYTDHIDIIYDEMDRVSQMVYIFQSGSERFIDLYYNELGDVYTIDYYYYYESLPGYRHLTQNFEYKEGTSQLEQIVRYDYDMYDGSSTPVDNNREVESSNFVYDENGILVSFFGKSETLNVYYADPFNTGESIFAEYWQSLDYNSITQEQRQHRSAFEPVYMPTYIDGLPPFVTVLPVAQVFNDLLFDLYVVTKTEVSSSDPELMWEPTYTYTTDEEGNLATYTRNYLWNGWQSRGYTYTFEY